MWHYVSEGGGNMRYCNLHNHTVFSDGIHTVQEQVAVAQAKNMLALGFSDHSYTECDPSYCMKKSQYDAYLQTIEAAKKSSTIPIYAGLELDRYSDDDCSAFDFTIASVHYVIKDGVCHPIDHSLEQQQTCIRDAFGGSVLDMAKCYFDLLCEHVENVKPTFVGHFDVITKFSIMPEEDERYLKIAEDALKQIIKVCPYIEMNTGAVARGLRKLPYPGVYLLDTLKNAGGKILLNADSHRAENMTFWFDEAVQLLKKNGVNEIHMFNGTGFDPVSI